MTDLPSTIWLGTHAHVSAIYTALSTVSHPALTLTPLMLVGVAFDTSRSREYINLPMIAQYIKQFMPENDPGIDRVTVATVHLAAFIHAFYSEHNLWGTNGTSPYSLFFITQNQDCCAGIGLPDGSVTDYSNARYA